MRNKQENEEQMASITIEEQLLSEQMQQSLNLEDKDNTINSIPISKFKPNQIQMMEGKLYKQQSVNDKEEVKIEPKSPVSF